MAPTPHETFMRRAIELAVANVADGGGPFGALVVRRGEVIAEGVNRVTAGNDPTAHAEIEAIRAACARLDAFHLPGCALYTSCEPCPMCLGAAYWARLDRIWYAAHRDAAGGADFLDERLYRELCLPPAERTLPIERVLAEESDRPFAAWRRQADRLDY
jgi:tRNA(Arg) A34 adenosine deaminase TadA